MSWKIGKTNSPYDEDSNRLSDLFLYVLSIVKIDERGSHGTSVISASNHHTKISPKNIAGFEKIFHPMTGIQIRIVTNKI